MEIAPKQKHFVLVHGACHGAWCWFKLKPRLEYAGHRVTALDLSASGTNTRKIEEITTAYDYSLPLIEFMEAIPAGEKVILVAHSLGGLNVALVMEMYPYKVNVAVFLTAFMPDITHDPSYVIDKFLIKYNECNPPEAWLDTQFLPYGGGNTMLFGPKFLSTKLYQNSTTEDLSLGAILIRTGSLFLEDLSKAKKFSAEGYGSVKRVFIVCDEDLAIKKEFQLWMVENNPVNEVKEINGADHMPMFSKPQELCHCLLDVACDYS